MQTIYLSDDKRRDAQVNLDKVTKSLKVRYVLPDGKSSKNVKILKSTLKNAGNALKEKAGNIEKIADLLIEGDPEINFNYTGKIIKGAERIYLRESGDLAYSITILDEIFAPDGKKTSEKPHEVTKSNVAAEIPLKWTGKTFDKKEAIRKFVFSYKYQISHTNGLTYDFLYSMAKELHDSNSLMLIGGGEKGTDPIVLKRGSKPYRGFLEGRVDKSGYILLLHLTNLELKELV